MASDPHRAVPPPMPLRPRVVRDVPAPTAFQLPDPEPLAPPSKPRKVTPSGMAYPSLATADGAVPIVLTWRTVLRLLGPTLALLLAGGTAVVSVVAEIRHHMADQQIHLARGERDHLIDRTALAIEVQKLTKELALDQRARTMQALEQINAALQRYRDEVARESKTRRELAPARRTGSRR